MAGSTWDFGEATWIAADALGRPGQRRFRLLVHSRPETAWLWCEKEQLTALSIATEQVIFQFGDAIGRDWEGSPAPEDPPSPTVEFTIGRLALGFDQEQSVFALLVYDRDVEDEDAPPTLVCRVSKSQLKQLAERIVELAAAGRPRCPLCGAPIDAEGHICPRANGKVHHDVD